MSPLGRPHRFACMVINLQCSMHGDEPLVQQLLKLLWKQDLAKILWAYPDYINLIMQLTSLQFGQPSSHITQLNLFSTAPRQGLLVHKEASDPEEPRFYNMLLRQICSTAASRK